MSTTKARVKIKVRKATLENLVEAAHAAGAEVKVSLSPKPETTAEGNQRIVNQAMQGRRRLSINDAQQLASAYTVAKAVGKMYRELSEVVQKDLDQLDEQMKHRSDLANQLSEVARSDGDRFALTTGCGVWRCAANLVFGLRTKHFPTNTSSPQQTVNH